MATLVLSYTLILLLQVIAGRHLRYGQLGSVNPIVQIEVKGVHADNNIKLTQHCRGCEFYNDKHLYIHIIYHITRAGI